MNCNEQEKLYSPSLWSKRENVIENHINFAEEVTLINRQNIPCILNIPYGKKDRQKIDLYGSDLPDDAPIFLFIHGGYWQELSKDQAGYVVQPFYKNKIKSFIIGYSLCPQVTVNDIVAEVETAVKKCIEYAQKHGSKGIYISGYSAGSQLISILFSTLFPKLESKEKHLFKAAILCCGIYDLTPLINTSINKPLKLDTQEAKLLSPMFHSFKGLPLKVHVVVGEYDSPAFIEQSQLYFKKIKSLTNATFKIIKDVDHFSIVEQYSDKNYELVKFILDLNTNENITNTNIKSDFNVLNYD